MIAFIEKVVGPPGIHARRRSRGRLTEVDGSLCSPDVFVCHDPETRRRPTSMGVRHHPGPVTLPTSTVFENGTAHFIPRVLALYGNQTIFSASQG